MRHHRGWLWWHSGLRPCVWYGVRAACVAFVAPSCVNTVHCLLRYSSYCNELMLHQGLRCTAQAAHPLPVPCTALHVAPLMMGVATH